MITIDTTCGFSASGTEMRLPSAANHSGPPDGFDPNRDGAALWLAIRMRYRNIEASQCRGG